MVIPIPDVPVAHSPGPDGEWDALTDHAARVAGLARRFAEAFGAGDVAAFLGLTHDLYKANPAFGRYLLASHRAAVSGGPRPASRVPHALGGAAFAYAVLKAVGAPGWDLVAPCIAGHHTGLPSVGTLEQALKQFVDDNPAAVPLMARLAKELGLDPQDVPRVDRSGEPTAVEMRTRFLFSALIDADHLDTERHFDPSKATRRGVLRPPLRELWRSLEEHRPSGEGVADDVLRVRNEVYAACLDAAVLPTGFFRLTVPTGGGKTRSGLAFALRHALAHGLRSLVFALPYTSIVDQTAEAYRSMLPPGAVLEHHSAADLSRLTEHDDDPAAARLAGENWDRPVVVTTTVQLFESLLGAKPGPSRKLHRLARGVIVLDEIQAFPPHLLEPTMDALAWLARPVELGGAGSTVVFCTATQPPFAEGRLAGVFAEHPVREIVPDYPRHFRELRRVEYELRPDPAGWTELGAGLRGQPQVLAVVNARRDALALLDALGEDDAHFHLSTLLCGAHRRRVLQDVARRLRAGRPVRLVSTQVVECGVDLDFPVVYRAVGPLDRIVQAAGRCNRHGARSAGRVVIFEPAAGTSPWGPYRRGLEKTRLLLDRHPPEALHDPALHRDYFRRLYAELDLDERGIQALRAGRDFPEVAARYRLIDDDTVPVVVPYGAAWAPRLAAWQADPSRENWRRLQAFVVGVFRRDVERYRATVEEIAEGVYRCQPGGYDGVRHRGLLDGFADPSDLLPTGTPGVGP